MNFEQYLEKLATDDQATRKTEELLQSLSIQELRKLAGLEELVRPVVPLLDDAAIMAMRLYKPEESQTQIRKQLSGGKTKKAESKTKSAGEVIDLFRRSNALTGVLAGGTAGYLSADKDHKLEHALVGAGLGGIAGHITTGPLVNAAERSLPKSKSLEELVVPGLFAVPGLVSGTGVGVGASKLLSRLSRNKEKTSSVGSLNETGLPDVPDSELTESIEEARSREDVLGRGKRWGLGGGVLGAGAGAAAGAGMGLLARRLGLSSSLGKYAPVAGAAALGTLGAGAGYRLGRTQGQEEALADRAVSLARAIKARQAGMVEGFDMASLGYPKEASKTKTAEPTWAELGRALLRDPRVIGTALGGLLGASTGIATSEKGSRLRNAAVGAGTGAGMGMLAGSFAGYPSKVLVPEKVEAMAREIFNKTTQAAMEAGEARGKRQMIPMAQSVAGQDVETLKDIMNALSEKEQNALGQLSTFSQNIDTIRDM